MPLPISDDERDACLDAWLALPVYRVYYANEPVGNFRGETEGEVLSWVASWYNLPRDELSIEEVNRPQEED